MTNTYFLDRLDTETLQKIFDAQMEELLDRREVQDRDLFKRCFELEAPDEAGLADVIRDFQGIAASAFGSYHRMRAKGAVIDPDTKELRLPAVPPAVQDDDTEDAAEEAEEDTETED